MHFTATTRSPEDHGTNRPWVRSVFALSPTETRFVDFEVPTGIPERAFSALLDAHVQRRSSLKDRRPRTDREVQENAVTTAKLLSILAAQTLVGRSLAQDPLFWLLRSRHAVRSATLAHHRVERSGHSRTLAIPQGSPPTPLQHRLLATWACRHRYSHQGFGGIRAAISARRPFTWETQTGRDTQARHWLLWLGVISGFTREELFKFSPIALLDHLSTEELADGCLDKDDAKIPLGTERGPGASPEAHCGACGAVAHSGKRSSADARLSARSGTEEGEASL